MKINIPEPETVADMIPASYNCLVYGKHGAGKTEFAATWAELGDVLYLDSDNGMLTIKSSPRISNQFKQIIRRVPISDKSPDPNIRIPVGHAIAYQVLDEIDKHGEFGNFAPDTIVLDSLTTMSKFTLTHVLTRNRKSADAQPSLPDWGAQMRCIGELIDLGVAADVNFICIAHEQFIKDELSGRTWCLPLVTGKMAHNLGSYFDEVYHAVVKESGGSHKYELETKATGMITAKSRLDLPSPITSHFASIKPKLDEFNKQAAQQKANLAATGNIGGLSTQTTGTTRTP